MKTSWKRRSRKQHTEGRVDTSTGWRIQEKRMEDGNVGVFVDGEFVLGAFDKVVERERRFAFQSRCIGE